jgi:hypothetical protein
MISLAWRATYANSDGTNVLRDSKFKYEFIELLKIACQRNEWVQNTLGKRDWSVGTNRRVRQVLDRFAKGANNDRNSNHFNITSSTCMAYDICGWL